MEAMEVMGEEETGRFNSVARVKGSGVAFCTVLFSLRGTRLIETKACLQPQIGNTTPRARPAKARARVCGIGLGLLLSI